MGPPTAVPHPVPGGDGLPPPPAAALPDPARAALVVLGLQRDLPELLPGPCTGELLASVRLLRDRAGALGVPVVHGVERRPAPGPGPAGGPPPGPLEPRVGEYLVDHARPNAFLGSRLARVLRTLGRDQLVLCGLLAEHTVLTAADALGHGFTACLASDAVADLTAERRAAALRRAARHGALIRPAGELFAPDPPRRRAAAAPGRAEAAAAGPERTEAPTPVPAPTGTRAEPPAGGHPAAEARLPEPAGAGHPAAGALPARPVGAERVSDAAGLAV
ncbi:isochorismatase [Streptomyces solincola]|uniref:Isochorismatase n=1 Tax=Streptomyces solincola TaxID=2100817 RepID=A0A2S9PSH7_9ACTN|nr:isochorismatase family protein [Streptomyces solincola]PRH77378.1 isochorismatase [Streptomyces solincola]